MKKKIQKRKELEKANIDRIKNKALNRPDFEEISMTHEDLEKIAQANAQFLSQRNDPVLRKYTVRRQEKLLRKIFKAASQVLTDSQFQIFTMRYVYNMPEADIIQQVDRKS